MKRGERPLSRPRVRVQRCQVNTTFDRCGRRCGHNPAVPHRSWSRGVHTVAVGNRDFDLVRSHCNSVARMGILNVRKERKSRLHLAYHGRCSCIVQILDKESRRCGQRRRTRRCGCCCRRRNRKEMEAYHRRHRQNIYITSKSGERWVEFLYTSMLPSLLLSLATCAIPGHEITSLPGWEGALPTKMYSGYIPVGNTSGTKGMIHYVSAVCVLYLFLSSTPSFLHDECTMLIACLLAVLTAVSDVPLYMCVCV